MAGAKKCRVGGRQVSVIADFSKKKGGIVADDIWKM